MNQHYFICSTHGLQGLFQSWVLLEDVEPLLAEGGLGPAAGLGTMRPRTGARVVAPAAIIDRTQPSPSRTVYIICLCQKTVSPAMTQMQVASMSSQRQLSKGELCQIMHSITAVFACSTKSYAVCEP